MGHFGARRRDGPGTWQGRAGRLSLSRRIFPERIDNIPDLPIYARRDALSSFPDYRCPCHWHRDLEFIHVISGQMQYFVNGAIVTLEAGNGLVVEVACILPRRSREAMLVHLRGGRPRTA